MNDGVIDNGIGCLNLQRNCSFFVLARSEIYALARPTRLTCLTDLPTVVPAALAVTLHRVSRAISSSSSPSAFARQRRPNDRSTNAPHALPIIH